MPECCLITRQIIARLQIFIQIHIFANVTKKTENEKRINKYHDGALFTLDSFYIIYVRLHIILNIIRIHSANVCILEFHVV